MKLALRLAALVPLIVPLTGAAEEVFPPKAGKGPVVIVVSGMSGTAQYRGYAGRIADLGYSAVLIDGNTILTREQDGAANLRTTIARAQASPGGTPDKVVLIGFSRGGGGILAHGTAMADLVKAAIVYYPATSWAKNPGSLGTRIRLPVLVLAGEQDQFNNCCLIGTMREMEAAAKARQLPLELVVYPHADHAFNLDGRNYRHADSEDAWRRVSELLAKHHAAK